MRLNTPWSRLDEHLLEFTLGLALLLVGLFGVLFPVLGVTGPFAPLDSRPVEISGVTRVPEAVSAGGAVLGGTDQARLTFADPDFQQRLLLALPGIVGGLLLVLVLEQLMRMARSLRNGDVFARRNVTRLHVIAVGVLLIGLLEPLAEAISTELLVHGTPLEDEVAFSFSFSGGYLLLALLVAALGEAFRRGAKLRDDTEGLV
ncbi:DUF2975 domain-containing protein [Streptomyces sp. TP-A0874]|uniref:DUF2975 domain-containing protein n=1 Tax=Streptomyces sp. TP-A0874 TaxID=549819 RepID=UPI000853433B|nr:DUF2975 domain-containing protein [Streptomyces sp. TP-A0874]